MLPARTGGGRYGSVGVALRRSRSRRDGAHESGAGQGLAGLGLLDGHDELAADLLERPGGVTERQQALVVDRAPGVEVDDHRRRP